MHSLSSQEVKDRILSGVRRHRFKQDSVHGIPWGNLLSKPDLLILKIIFLDYLTIKINERI